MIFGRALERSIRRAEMLRDAALREGDFSKARAWELIASAKSKRLDRGHSVVDEHLELARVVAVGEDADVAPIADRDAGVERRPKAPSLLADRGRLRIGALLPSPVLQDRITRARLAGDPPDLLISPRVGKIGWFDFHRAEETIA